VLDLLEKPLGDEIYGRLIDDLVFDGQERIRTENAGWLGEEKLTGSGRLVDAAPQTVL